MNCPICSSPETKCLNKIGDYELCYCRKCRIRFSNPMRHPGQTWYENSDIYEEVRWNLPALKKLGKRWEFSLALKNLNPDMGSVFDIGCGRGDFLKLAQSHSFSVSGIDLNGVLVRTAKEAYGLEYIEQSSIEDYPKRHPGETFGAVTAFEVLEHLPDPRQFIAQCHALLNSHGRLVISVPGYNRWPKWVNSEVDLPPHHLILWSEPALRHLLETHGFSKVQTFRKPFLLNDLMYHAVRWVPGLQSPGIIFKFVRGFLKILLIPAWMLINLHPRAGGYTLLVVGEK